MSDVNELKAYLDAIKLYDADMSLAKTEQDRRAAQDRLLKSLKSAKVSNSLIDKTQKLVESFADNDLTGLSILQDALKNKVKNIQDLEKSQADKLMNIMSQPEQAKVGIASFAMTIATICRFFGADEFAQSIENKASEIMSTVKVPLNTSKMGDQRAIIAEAIDNASNYIGKSSALEKGAQFAENHKDLALPNPTDPFINDAPQQQNGNSKVAAHPADKSWQTYKEAMLKNGVKAEHLNDLMPAWIDAATKEGAKAQLDTPKEIVGFVASAAVKKLSPEERKAVTETTRELTPMGSQTVTQ